VRKADLLLLFEYNDWANDQILGSAEQLSPDDFAAPSEITYRNLRGTLVHTLDVERSWMRRLRGEPRERWDVELNAEDFPTVGSLAAAWQQDRSETMNWLNGLTEERFDAVVDLGPKDRFPLSWFLLHVITHSAQQRRDAALLLEGMGNAPPEIEFLNYADSRSQA
jgi:uncharacterized damage-inducible protein DinB